MGFRILIADDEPLIRVDLRELLEELGHEVVAEATDGKEALALIETKRPDLVILDIKMPTMDGIQVATEIDHLYPVIILTAYTEGHLIERAKEAGVMAYISKPFREGDVSPAIQLAVSHFLERSDLAARVSRLQKQLDARKVIEQAKGLLMGKEGLSEAESYRHLQKISMDKNRTMKEVAEAIILMLG
jgi:AmiR/NasT family two-component response regulator